MNRPCYKLLSISSLGTITMGVGTEARMAKLKTRLEQQANELGQQGSFKLVLM